MRMGESHELKLTVWLTNGAPTTAATEVHPQRNYNAQLRLQAPSFEFNEPEEKPLRKEQPLNWDLVLSPKDKHKGEQKIVAEVRLRDLSDANRIMFAMPYAPAALRCSVTVTDPVGLPGWAVNAAIPITGSLLFLISGRIIQAWRAKPKARYAPSAPAETTPIKDLPSPATPLPACQPLNQRTFLVALSFPGEQRLFIAAVADALTSKLGKNPVFFDEYYEAELAQPDLDLLIGNIYEHQSKLLVPFFSADYARKKWCNLEWRRMRQILFSLAAERIMPFRFDDAPIEGFLPTDGYIKVGTRTPEEVARLILERLQTLPPDTAPGEPPPS